MPSPIIAVSPELAALRSLVSKRSPKRENAIGTDPLIHPPLMRREKKSHVYDRLMPVARLANPPHATVAQNKYLRFHMSVRIPMPAEMGRLKTPVARAIYAPKYRSRCEGLKPKSCAMAVKFGAMIFCGDQIAIKAKPRRSDWVYTVSPSPTFFRALLRS